MICNELLQKEQPVFSRRHGFFQFNRAAYSQQRLSGGKIPAETFFLCLRKDRTGEVPARSSMVMAVFSLRAGGKSAGADKQVVTKDEPICDN